MKLNCGGTECFLQLPAYMRQLNIFQGHVVIYECDEGIHERDDRQCLAGFYFRSVLVVYRITGRSFVRYKG